MKLLPILSFRWDRRGFVRPETSLEQLGVSMQCESESGKESTRRGQSASQRQLAMVERNARVLEPWLRQRFTYNIRF